MRIGHGAGVGRKTGGACPTPARAAAVLFIAALALTACQSGRSPQAEEPVAAAAPAADQSPSGRQVPSPTQTPVQAGERSQAPSPEAGASVPPPERLDALRGALLEGRLVDVESSSPLADAAVVLEPDEPSLTVPGGERRTRSDAQGHFRLEQIVPGAYRLSAFREGWRLVPGPRGGPTGYLITLQPHEQRTSESLALFQGQTLTGTVMEQDTERPLEGATVTAVIGTREGPTATTDAGGRFQMRGLFAPPGTRIDVRARRSGYTAPLEPRPGDGPASVMFPDAWSKATCRVVLQPAVTVSGRVVDHTSAPLARATVSLFVGGPGTSGRDAATTETAPDGTFQLDAPPRGQVRLTAKLAGSGLAPAQSSLLTLTTSSLAGVVLRLEPGASLAGQVVGTDEQPVAGAQVSVSQRRREGMWIPEAFREQVESRPNGDFVFTGLSSGDIEVFATRRGAAPARSQTVTLQPGETRTGLRLTLRAPHSLGGIVLDKDRKPVGNVLVYLSTEFRDENPSRSQRTGPDGRFRFEEISEAPVDVNAFTPDSEQVVVRQVQPDRDDVEVLVGQDLTIVARVTDVSTGEPIPDAVMFNSFGHRAEGKPDRPGVLELTLPRRLAIMSMTISAPGYQPVTEFIDPRSSAAGRVEKTIRLGRGGALTGRVVDQASRQPLPGVPVGLSSGLYASERESPSHQVTTGSDGRFLLENLPYGPVNVVVVPAGRLRVLKEAEVENGQTNDLGDIEVGRGAALNGRVVRMPGETGVGGARLVLTGASGGRQMTRESDPSGAFTFQDLPNGLYTLSAPALGAEMWVGFENNETKNVTLPVGSVRLNGRVVRNGQGEAAQVSLVQYGLGQSIILHASAGRDGSFTKEGLTPGPWTVNVRSSVQQELSLQKTITLPAEGTADETFELPSLVLAGRVVDAAGQPVAGARVSARRFDPVYVQQGLLPRPHEAVSGADGAFSLGDLAEGNYHVTASKGTASASAGQVAVGPGGAAGITLKLNEAEGGTLVSVALNMTNGLPVPSAWCYLFAADGSLYEHKSTRDIKGVMTVPNIPPGSYRVQVSSAGFAVAEHQVTIRAGETVRLEDVLYEAGALKWALRQADGQPARGIPCEVKPTDPNSVEPPRSGVSDREGTFVARGLMPGPYQATARSASGNPVTIQFSIAPHNLTQMASEVR